MKGPAPAWRAAWIISALLWTVAGRREDALMAQTSRKLQQSPKLLDELPEVRPTIAGGVDAPCGRYTYMVSLRDTQNVHMCGGVLIDKRWVLTAAHCVDPNSRSSLGPTPVVVIGSCNLGDRDNVERSIASDVHVHDKYDGNVSKGYDIALLKLKDDSVHTPVSLPSSKENALSISDSNLLALGWGINDNGERPERLQQAFPIQIIQNSRCAVPVVWGSLIKDHMVCALGLEFNLDTCSGDSGGPLVRVFTESADLSQGDPALDTVVAITSFGENKDCGLQELPGVYMSVSYFRKWIDKKIKKGKKNKKNTRKSQTKSPKPPVADALAPELSPSHADDPISAPSPEPLRSPEAPPPSTNELTNAGELDQMLWNSASGGKIDQVREAVDLGANVEVKVGRTQSTPLIVAAQGGHLEVVEFLIQAGADVNAANGFQGVTALYMAATFGYLDVAEVLIDAGADVDKARSGGTTPLYIAARQGFLPVVSALLEADAEVDKAREDGASPLFPASREGHADVVTVLLVAGADPNAENEEGIVALSLASATVGSPSEEIATALLEHGAEIDSQNERGRTPLMAAAMLGNAGVVEILVGNGADRGLTDDSGASAEDLICACLESGAGEGKIQCPEGGCEKKRTAGEIADLLELK